MPRRLIAPFSDPKLRSLLALAGERARALALVLLDTGPRLSDHALLRVGDIRPDGTLHLMETVFRSDGMRDIRTPFRAANVGAPAERVIQTIRAECLDRTLIPTGGLSIGRSGPTLSNNRGGPHRAGALRRGVLAGRREGELVGLTAGRSAGPDPRHSTRRLVGGSPRRAHPGPGAAA